MLMILDGFGLSDHTDGNAVYSAKRQILTAIGINTPRDDQSFDRQDCLKARWEIEVGHTNIGAGR